MQMRAKNAIRGSGSFEKDSPIYIIAVEQEEQTDGRSMTSDAGKRQRQTHKTGQTLREPCYANARHERFLRSLFPQLSAALKAASASVQQCP